MRHFFQKEALLNGSKRILSLQDWRRRLLFWIGGLTVGLVCVAFAVVCDHINNFFTQWIRLSYHPAMAFVVTPLGFMLISFLRRRYFGQCEGSGIPQVVAALRIQDYHLRDKLVSLRIAIGKFVLTALGFLCGASIGREGPTIQLSASLMHVLGRWASFDRQDIDRGLLLAGGAAGIAAAFNAPLAGIVFAIEELRGSFDKGVSGTIIRTVVLSGIVAQALLGNYLYFGRSSAMLDIWHSGWYVILCVAILGGAAGGLFSALLVKTSAWLKPWLRKYPWWITAILGLLVALVGFSTQGITYGSGYEAARGLITGQQHLGTTIFYGPWKMLATLLTYLSGIPGGIFAPSLSTGAGLGALIATFFNNQFHQVIILLATVAYFSGVVQSPITAFVIVLEMTDNTASNMVLPIMITSMIATAVSKTICREPLYQKLALRYLPHRWQ